MSEVRNWSGVHRFRPYARHWPGSEAEVAAIVRTARERGETVRVVGAGHSWSDAIHTDGHLVSLDKMQRLLAVDRARHRVTVEAGVRLFQLNEILAEHGLAMSVLGSVAQQSVAGATATGTHGTGVGFGNIATAVVGLRLVTADGQVLDIDEQHPLLAAARIHIGALGVVTAVTLQVEPAFRLREKVELIDFDRAVSDMEAIITAGEHVKLWWLPHTDQVRVSTLDRTEDAETTRGPRIDRGLEALDEFLNSTLYPAMLSLSARKPSWTPRINQLVLRSLGPGERVGRSDRVFNLTMPPVHRETEYGVPRERAGEALVGLRELIERDGLYVNFPAEVRFVAADDVWLSGAYGRDSCQLGAYIGECDSCEPYMRGFERLALELDGRPHWGKEMTTTTDEMRRVFPRFDRFAAVRAEIDPDGVFANRFVRRIFDL